MLRVAALIFLGLGSIGWVGSTVLEIKTRRPLYELLIKLFAVAFGIGGILFGLGGL